jgi:AcrR family transcriptional regulator
VGIPGRNERRKAETRQKIMLAAAELFLERGYDGTSMEEISRSADVAIRTIYLHFESKAAVFLANFDAWMDEFVGLVGERSADESVDDAMARALDVMNERGWGLDLSVGDVPVLPVLPQFIGSGSPEIAGHMLQRWVAAIDELTRRFRTLSGAPTGSPEPRIEASAVFGAWMASILDFRERFESRTPGDSAHEVGIRAIRAYTAGLDATSAGTPAARG